MALIGGVTRPLLLLAGVLAASACGRWADALACADVGCEWTDQEWARLGRLAGPGPLPPDPTNAWADDPRVARLGQSFYFDAGFSGPSRALDSLRRPTQLARAPVGEPSQVSCATCHDLARGGVDVSSAPGHVSVGAGLTDVNALPTLNVARRRTLFWNGRMTSHWGLVALVGESETTMNGTRLQTAHRLLERYAGPLEAAFGTAVPAQWRTRVPLLPPRGKPGPGCHRAADPELAAYDCLSDEARLLATQLFVLWAKALAAYGRLLESGDSPLDRFIAEGPGSPHLDAGARRGARLFVGKAGCLDCHDGPLLTDEGFHNVGVPQVGPGVPTVAECVAGGWCDCVAGWNCLPGGRLAGLRWRGESGGAAWLALAEEYRDDGRPGMAGPADVQIDERWRGAWRTPSLRDVERTAPYMHDGAYRTLEDVLWHYNDGGRGAAAAAVGVRSVKLKPLGLTADEIADLVAFLRALTGAPVPEALREPEPAP